MCRERLRVLFRAICIHEAAFCWRYNLVYGIQELSLLLVGRLITQRLVTKVKFAILND